MCVHVIIIIIIIIIIKEVDRRVTLITGEPSESMFLFSICQ